MEQNKNTDLSELTQKLVNKGLKIESLIKLSNEVFKKEKRHSLSFNELLYEINKNPEYIFRDIFQIIYDLVHHFIPKGIDEYPNTGNSIGYIHYDSSNLLENDCEYPFFADRLFVNRFMKLIDGFKSNIQKNRIYLFEGPPGSGKSTFLNNFLKKLEDYTITEQGTVYKTEWRLDFDKLNTNKKFEQTISNIPELNSQYYDQVKLNQKKSQLIFSCPNHDHPILQIPIEYRKEFLEEIIEDPKLKKEIFTNKQYEWVFKEKACSICKTIHSALVDGLEDPLDVYRMLYAKPMLFNRQLGDGISVFNPGDNIVSKNIENPTLQGKINHLFDKTSVTYKFSHLAKTNNGVYALMDIKEFNAERLKNLHGIISDGVHKVDLIEERIKSFFVGLINPSDTIHYESIPSFKDRVTTIKIPYILDYNTEVEIYLNKFGENIKRIFLPQVLENFAKIIISSRMNSENSETKKWITSPAKYSKYVDTNLLLLKMDIYAGTIPSWLIDDDVKKLDFTTRKEIINSAVLEGDKGFSGRKSLTIFNDFLNKHQFNDQKITMQMVDQFFLSKDEYINKIPEGFLKSIVDLYDYNIMQEIKEAIYFFNKEKIATDIKDYLYAINFNLGTVKKSIYTDNEIEITEDYLKGFETVFLGVASTKDKRNEFREENQTIYISQTLSQEIKLKNKNIEETTQFIDLFTKYKNKVKEGALEPYYENKNFRRAILDFNTEQFKTYDRRLNDNISMLISNLKKKFKYSTNGAKQICIYAIDKELFKKY